jgi:hypothetical protein
MFGLRFPWGLSRKDKEHDDGDVCIKGFLLVAKAFASDGTNSDI